MKALLCAIVLFIIGIICAGFCLGWFHVATHNAEQNSNAMISVNKDKIRADGGKVKEKAEEFGQRAKETTGNQSGIVVEQERRP